MVGRYFDPARAISYAEEVIVYLIIWAIMIVSSQLVRTDGHVRPDLVLRLLPPRALRWIEIFNCLVAIVFCGALVWYGWQIVDTALLIDERSSSDLQFPMWIYYLALPVGGALMLVRYIIRLVRFALFFDPATMTVGHTLPRRDAGRIVAAAARPLGRIAGPHHADRCCSCCCSSACSPPGCRSSWCSACAPAILYIASGQPLVGAAQIVINELNSTTLMALPLFVMAATFMRSAASPRRWSIVATAWLGGIRGSLGLVTVVACTLFAAICGSQRRDRAGDGHHPDAGDDRARLSALLRARRGRRVRHDRHRRSRRACALILYGIVAEQSVPRLFLAGILPGLLQAAAFFVWVLYDARRRNFPVEPSLPFAERLRVTARALPALAVPLVVMVGIYGGFVTVTEAAALSAAVALLRVADRSIAASTGRETLTVIADGMRSAGDHHADHRDRARLRPLDDRVRHPRRSSSTSLLGHGFATWQFLLIINGLLLVLGCFLEVTATLLLVLPILAPALMPLGVDPVHFSIIFTHNMEIGLVHPPVGLNLFVLSTISAAPIGEVIRGILPFLILLLIVLGIITYVPVADAVAAERGVRLNLPENTARPHRCGLRAPAKWFIPALRQRVGDRHGQYDDGARGAPDAAVAE